MLCLGTQSGLVTGVAALGQLLKHTSTPTASCFLLKHHTPLFAVPACCL